MNQANPSEHTVSLADMHQIFLDLEMQTWDAYKICLSSLKLTENEFWILLEIGSSSLPFCQSDIARKLRLPAQTVNSALMKMTKKGWIDLVPLADNRKSKGILFTEEGRKICLPFLEKIYRAEESALGELGDDEIQRMIEYIQRYTQALEKNLQEEFADSN